MGYGGMQEPERRPRCPVMQIVVVAAVLGHCLPGSLVSTAGGEEAHSPAGRPTWIRNPGQSFSVSATETTVAQFRACVEAGACAAATTSTACNYGKPGHDLHPVNCVTYHGAEQYCAYVGGRVCTEEEWLAACKGSQGRAFPYGDIFDLRACNVQSQTLTVEGQERATAPVGSFTQCEGGLPGLFDMAGNVAEWVNRCNASYCRFRGAGYLSNDPVDAFAGCARLCSGNNQDFQSGVVGIRCCRDQVD